MNYLKTGSNTKLGKHIAAFSLPAVHTCPGRTKLCESFCYATSGFFNMNNVKNSLKTNYLGSQDPSFVSDINGQIQRSKTLKAVRIHPSGDFYNEAYVEKWIEIVKANPDVQFWAYTRSWRVPNMVKSLETLSALPNIELFASIDKETRDAPEQPPSWLRVADVVEDWSTMDRTYVRCPNLRNKNITCSKCTYCFSKVTTRKTNVVFEEH